MTAKMKIDKEDTTSQKVDDFGSSILSLPGFETTRISESHGDDSEGVEGRLCAPTTEAIQAPEKIAVLTVSLVIFILLVLVEWPLQVGKSNSKPKKPKHQTSTRKKFNLTSRTAFIWIVVSLFVAFITAEAEVCVK